MREIKLTQGKVALVDDEDFERLNQHKWYVSFERMRFYAARGIRNKGKHTTMRLHREIMCSDIGKDIDHINGNKTKEKHIKEINLESRESGGMKEQRSLRHK